MQDEDAIHSAREHGIDFVFLARHGEAHMQKIRRVREFVPRIDERLTDGILVGHGGDGRHLRDHADASDIALLRILDVDRVVIEGRQRADHADHDGHGMCVAAEAGVEPGHLLMHHRVFNDAAVERLVLLAGRKLTIQQEVAGLDETAVLGELVDRIAAIEENALVAVDEGDLRLAARRRGEARVVGEAAGILIERVDVDHVGPNRALADRQVVGCAVDQDRCLGRARRAEVFCDAHLKAPLTILWKTGRQHTQNFGGGCGPSELVFAVPHNRAVRVAVQQVDMLKC